MPVKIINVIPRPQKVEIIEGDFILSGKTAVSACNELSALKQFLLESLEHCTPQKISGDKKCEILLSLEKSLERLGDEGYVMNIQPGKMTIESSSPKGVFYGIQTFRQILFSSEKGKIPCLRIEDGPRLGWRGMMLDEGRHFFGKEFVKKFIDMLALY
ncbi:MAG: beta-N-acetylhexosaminidase, partial [Victivallales bacterium]